MYVRAFIIFFGFCIFGLSALAANAQGETLEDISQVYSQYKGALANGEIRSATSYAKTAWDLSEKITGDSKQTGDLAYNYAEISRALNTGKRNKTVEAAYERSLELSSYHADNTGRITLQRQVSYGRYFRKVKKSKKAKKMFSMAEDTAEKNSLLETGDYARLQYQKSLMAYYAGDYEDSSRFADLAVNTYAGLGKLETPKAYKAVYHRSRAQYKTEAYLSSYEGFRKIFTNMEDTLKPSDPLIGRAYHKASTARFRHAKSVGLDMASYFEESGEPAYWPNYEEKYSKLSIDSKKYKFERVSPLMPKNARSSGFVAILFDTNDEGRPENIRIVQRSHLLTFDAASIEALGQWKVIDKETGEQAKNVKNIPTTMTFNLVNEYGKYLDFYGRAMN